MQQILAILADIYTPAIALACVYCIRPTLKYYLYAFVWVWGIMLIDNALRIWLRFGLDYSTHTGLVLIFVLPFIWRWQRLQAQTLDAQHQHALASIASRQSIFATLSLVIYAGLMKFLGYHSWMDMLTTSVLLVPGLYWFLTLNMRNK